MSRCSWGHLGSPHCVWFPWASAFLGDQREQRTVFKGQSVLCLFLTADFITRVSASLDHRGLPLLSNSLLSEVAWLWQEITYDKKFLWLTLSNSPDFGQNCLIFINSISVVNSACLSWHLIWTSALMVTRAFTWIVIRIGPNFVFLHALHVSRMLSSKVVTSSNFWCFDWISLLFYFLFF